jgi:hypothetical protein
MNYHNPEVTYESKKKIQTFIEKEDKTADALKA